MLIMIARLVTITALLVAAMPGPGSCLDLDSLLARSVGGPQAILTLHQLESYRMVGRVAINDAMTGRLVQVIEIPNRSYTRMEMPIGVLEQAYDGATGSGWIRDHTGQVTRAEGFQLQQMKKGLYFDVFAHLFSERLEGGREYIGIDTVDGSVFHRVDFYPLNMDTVTLWLDTETALVKRISQKLDEMPALVWPGDYDTVRTVLFPTRVRMEAVGAPLTMEFVYDTIVLNQPLERDVFAVPGSEAVDVRFTGGKAVVVTPLEYERGHLRVKAAINGQTAWFILDSGASANMIDKTFAAHLDLDPVGTLPAKGIAGYEEVALAVIDSLRLDALTLFGMKAGVLDLSALGLRTSDSPPFAGILGYDFLSRIPLLIDYENQTLTLYHPDSSAALPAGGESVKFHLTMQIPTVSGNLAGFTGDFLIDLGNPFGLLIHPSFVQKHDLTRVLADIEDIDSAVGGIGGPVSGKSARVDQFYLSSVLLSDLRVLLLNTESGLAGSQQLAGNVGNLVLENFRVLLDYPRSRLVLLKKADERTQGKSEQR